MDAYFRKTRRPTVGLSGSLKRPPPKASPPVTTSTTTSALTTDAKFLKDLYDHETTPQSPPKTPRKPSKIADELTVRPITPTNSRLTRPAQPPPVKRKIAPTDLRRKRKPGTLTVRELFKSAHPLEQERKEKDDDKKSPQKQETPIKQTIIASPIKPGAITDGSVAKSLGLKRLILPATPPSTPKKQPEYSQKSQQHLQRQSPKKQQQDPTSPSKITSGPLKGVSTSLLDLIRAKEAKAKETPEQLRLRELLGISSDIVRIVSTLFISNKRDVIAHDKIVEKCYKGLNNNYSISTITDCLDLMNKVAPEWVTIIDISKGRFARFNKDKYNLPQLLEAIKRYRRDKNCY